MAARATEATDSSRTGTDDRRNASAREAATHGRADRQGGSGTGGSRNASAREAAKPGPATAAAAASTGARQNRQARTGNGGNDLGETLPVFFLWGEGCRDPLPALPGAAPPCVLAKLAGRGQREWEGSRNKASHRQHAEQEPTPAHGQQGKRLRALPGLRLRPRCSLGFYLHVRDGRAASRPRAGAMASLKTPASKMDERRSRRADRVSSL